ncbi:hypothetical protein H0H81_008903 [Sphagnurus paluster]|uniref:Uncharacterized protein n=1 Tax=Sphagnurus paluster TaxID=117069 RepID=A0A9P7GIQ2_9AGAR|nr:hypothetical protein H0H81_008903 [Sphagnurus paluster]
MTEFSKASRYPSFPDGCPEGSTSATLREYPEVEVPAVGRSRAALLAIQRFAGGNAGLLLVMGSQAFFAMMNVAVKKLNSIDPPVSTFEASNCDKNIVLYAKVQDPWLGPKGVRLLLVFRGFSG